MGHSKLSAYLYRKWKATGYRHGWKHWPSQMPMLQHEPRCIKRGYLAGYTEGYAARTQYAVQRNELRLHAPGY